jgi:hypothetical protein
VNFPEDTVILVIDEGVQKEQYLQIENNTTDSLDYDYHIILDEFKATPQFSTQFCDCFACLEIYPTTGSCTDLEPGDFWPFAVYVLADSLIGGKYFTVAFVNPNDPSDGDTITVMTEEGDTLADDPGDVSVNSLTGVNNDLDVRLSPNPASDILNVSHNSQNVMIRVLNITGEVVIQMNNTTAKGTDLDISDLQSGVYIVNVSSETGNVSKRVMIE